MVEPLQIKVCVIVDNVENLYSINKNDSLDKVIQDLCREFNKINDHLFGLQICIDEANKRYVYVTEQNFHKIIHGSVLKLIGSIDYMIKMIFDQEKYSWKTQSDWLRAFSTDIAFVSKLTEENLLNLIMKIEKCNPEELFDSLLALSNILENAKLNFVAEHFVRFLINHLKESANTDLYSTTLVLKVLGQIMNNYKHFDIIIYSNLTISDLTPYLWREEYADIQLYTLILINTFVKFSDNVKPIYIAEISSDFNKNLIFKHVIGNALKNERLAHQLYIYQTYLLSTYNQYKTNMVFMGMDEVSHEITQTPKLYSFTSRDSIEFEEAKRKSINSLLEVSETDAPQSPVLRPPNNMKINRSYRVISSGSEVSVELREPRQVSQLLPADVMELTRICLEYYSVHYKKNYSLSVLESNHPPGFYVVANDVCKIVCKILDIGTEEPDTTSTSFHPLAFACIDKKKFVEEVFCRAVWLLARTRREMKARTPEDHEKVLPVLECQFRMALQTKPQEYKLLTETLKKYTHEKVYEEWEKEREQEWKELLFKHPDMKELRKKFEEENTLLIKEQRLTILRKGAKFPKIVDKPTKGRRQYWHIKLKKHKLIYGDCLDDGRIPTKGADTIEITAGDIMHVVSGVVCPHVKDHRIKKTDLYPSCFSILLNQNEGSLDFLADNEEIANKWVDGLNVFVGKPMISSTFQKELDELATMDMNLYLLELQGIPIPLETPSVPPVPAEYRSKPPKPPKPSRDVLSRKTFTVSE